MSFILPYLCEKRRIIITFLIFSAVFAVTFYLYRLPISAVLYPTALCLIFGIIIGAFSYVSDYKKHKMLVELKERSDVAIRSQLESFSSVADSDYRSIIDHICDEKHDTERQLTKMYDDMIDYYTTWVHQIKTPIASMRLHLKREDTSLSRKLSSDLLHIEQYVDMVLTYLRMESDTTDYVFREINLDKLLKENIRRLRGDFIMKNISLNFEVTSVSVITDEKWLSFVIGQILSNALKYTKNGSVTITVEEPKTLCISDTGIGIAPEDIPRVFEKGFTGLHGREYSGASGIGLYLCKEICTKLGVPITIESEIDKGTTVRLNLDKKIYS
ncbi:MAG: sensor histidine kinase [Clostridia bacterium]|nr:sensor histidine kinase [Clostridia bacterium]